MRITVSRVALCCALGLAFLYAPSACSTFGSDPAEAAADGGPVIEAAASADAGDGTLIDAAPKRIFMTNSSFSGNLVALAQSANRYDGGGGLAAGDALCELEAAGLPRGKWHAWLSLGVTTGDGGTSGKAAIARFDDTGPRVSVAGEPVLKRLGERVLVLVPDRDGRTDGGASRVWTGTTSSGLAISPTADCEGWTASANSKGGAGEASSVNGWSDQYTAEFCEVAARLYCIED